MITYYIEGKSILVDVIVKRNNRNTYLRVKDGRIIITSFRKIDKNELDDLILKIKPKLIRYLNNKPESDERYINGIKRKIVFKEDLINDYSINDLEFIIYYKKNINDKEKLLNKYLKEYVKEKLACYIEQAKIDFNDFVDFEVIFDYKTCKTFYGKCMPKEHRITFSTICSRLTDLEMKYVVYHEFAHFKYKGHQKDFYDFLELKLPNSRKIQASIRKYL